MFRRIEVTKCWKTTHLSYPFSTTVANRSQSVREALNNKWILKPYQPSPIFICSTKPTVFHFYQNKKKPHGNRQSLIALHHYHHQQSVTQNQQLAMIFMVFVLLLNYPKPPSKLGDHLPVVSITKLCYFFRSAIPLWGVRVETRAWTSLYFIEF